MDIVVTVPKSEYANIQEEETWAEKQGPSNESGACCFWKVSRLPKRLAPGDRVYFVQNGHIDNYNEFWYFEEEGYECEVTGRFWEGPLLVMKVPSIRLKKPVPMKGFQGFRYIKRNEELQ